MGFAQIRAFQHQGKTKYSLVITEKKSDVKGNYAPILHRLNDLKIEQVNLEFAYNETGDLDDLRLLISHLSVGMWVVDVRNETTAGSEQVASLGEKGERIIGENRVSLNPDCGLSPDALEQPSIDEAFTKIKILTEGAHLLCEQMKTV